MSYIKIYFFLRVSIIFFNGQNISLKKQMSDTTKNRHAKKN